MHTTSNMPCAKRVLKKGKSKKILLHFEKKTAFYQLNHLLFRQKKICFGVCKSEIDRALEDLSSEMTKAVSVFFSRIICIEIFRY